ncbi:MAG: FecR family protein [Pegethrix bostrychoides GSE-TBD4-15B]|jgi:hypothetical protein|uniref:FecR family protein n=1 Tax=Pegethrix bostrychoides GSE-TBD4-15B TaxID=2839662 RepID=A0A951U417_9CYAN|nr:FecR family protein [Pegethrix bostrychoides GSE-TBD4-15B]
MLPGLLGLLGSSLRRLGFWLGLGWALSLLVISPIYSAPDSLNVRINRWLEVQQLSGTVTYQQGSRSRSARLGDRLQAVGDRLATGSDSTATLAVDTQIGTVEVAERTSLLIKALEITPSDGRITRLQVDKGRVQLRVRPFTNPDSRLEIETPAGVSGVRGTEFGVVVSPTGKMGVATLEGSVVTDAQGEEVEVPAGFQNVTLPGEPPTQPVPFNNQPNFEYRVERVIRRSIRRIVVEGQVDPTSTVLIKGEPQEIDRDGRFSLLLPAPSRLRLTVTVITPLGQEQSYDLELI